MTHAELERICEAWLEELADDLTKWAAIVQESDPGWSVKRRDRIRALNLIRHCWDTTNLPDEMKGEQIPPPAEKTYRYVSMKM